MSPSNHNRYLTCTMKIFVILATVTATSLAAPYYEPVKNQWPSTQMSRSTRSSTTAELEEDPAARTHKLLKKPLFSHHHLHRPYHHFRENEENVASQTQENKNLLQTEDKVELHLNTEHVDKTSGRNIGSDNSNVFEEKNVPKNVNDAQLLKEKENIDLAQIASIEDHAAKASMTNSENERTQMSKNSMPNSKHKILSQTWEAKNNDQTEMTKKMTDDMMMRKSRPHQFEARGAYDAGAGLGGSSAGGSGSIVGVFSNANVGGCAVPVLLSCSPSIVSGSLSKPHSYGYGAYRTSEDFQMHNMRRSMKNMI